MSYSYTRSAAFTITHARHLSSKVAADMYLSAAYYDMPAESVIASYAEELAVLLRDGYVSQYEFGFKKNEQRILCWRYVVQADGTLSTDDKAGKLLSSANVSGATFYNYLWRSNAWWKLSQAERDRITKDLPIQRTGCDPPSDGAGYWLQNDRHYSSGGNGLDRATFRPY